MKLLHIDSSILGDNSASRQLSAGVVKPGRRPNRVEVTTATWPTTLSTTFPAPRWVALGTAAELRDAAQRTKPS